MSSLMDPKVNTFTAGEVTAWQAMSADEVVKLIIRSSAAVRRAVSAVEAGT